MKETDAKAVSIDDTQCDPGAWVGSEDAGRRLGLSPNTLAEWRCERRKNQPPFAKFGKAVRYRLADLDAWAASQVVKPLRLTT
jgi:hypothetical protein